MAKDSHTDTCTKNLGLGTLDLLASVQQPEDFALLLSTAQKEGLAPLHGRPLQGSSLRLSTSRRRKLLSTKYTLSTFTHGTEEGFANCLGLT